MNILTPEQLCERLQITKPSLYKLVHLRKVPYAKIGKRLRFDEEKIERWIEEKTVEAVNG